MVEKMNYKKYLNYPHEVTEVVDSTSVETMNVKSERDKETDDNIVNIEYDQSPGIEEIDFEPKTGTKPLENAISNKTRTEIVYKPDPDIDIEEFKQEPMDASEMLSSLSSETNSLSEPRHKSSETGTDIANKPDLDIGIEEFKQEPFFEC